MDPSPEFYLSLLALVLGAAGSLYLFIEWLVHKRKHQFLLLWSIGLLLQYLFQIPVILFNLGKGFILTDFNAFFSLTLSLSFLGLLLVYLGILYAIGRARKTHIHLVVWFALIAILYSFVFYDYRIFTSDTPMLITAFLFYIPLYVLILYALWKWYRKDDWIKTRITTVGIIMLAIATVIGIVKSFVFLWGGLVYPPSFWFVPSSSSCFVFVSQSLEVISFVLGFLFVHKNCFKNSKLEAGE